MRVLLSRTDALGDLLISLPVMDRILAHMPSAEIHWLVRPQAAPLLENIPGIAGVHLREASTDLKAFMEALKPEALLNLYHRDRAITVSGKAANIPIRVARARGLDQILAATHVLWKGRYGTGRHESQNVLDFLSPWNLQGGVPTQPRLVLSQAEKDQGQADLSEVPHPRLGVVLRGSGAGAVPSQAWWDKTLPVLKNAGWNPVVLSPAELGTLPPTHLRGLLGRIQACDVLMGPSTGPAHMAAALEVPQLILIGKRVNHGPDRWAPLGQKVQRLTYPGPEADLTHGLDRLNPEDLLPHLERLKG